MKKALIFFSSSSLLVTLVILGWRLLHPRTTQQKIVFSVTPWYDYEARKYLNQN